MSVILILLAQLLIPDPRLSPGVVDPSLTEATICSPAWHTTQARNVTDATKQAVFDAYKIDRRSGRYEIDHRVSIELGGSNDAKNLWPQAYFTQPFNATVKDGLENRLHHLVCTQGADKIPLAQAQAALLAPDWRDAYKTYVCAARIKLTTIESKACDALK